MSEGRRNPHYDGMVVTLRRTGGAGDKKEWLLFSEMESGITSSMNFTSDEKTALDWSQVLVGWFDAELVVEKEGE